MSEKPIARCAGSTVAISPRRGLALGSTFKRLRRKTKGARDWFDRLRRANPALFAHWQLLAPAKNQRCIACCDAHSASESGHKQT